MRVHGTRGVRRERNTQFKRFDLDYFDEMESA